MVQWKQEIKVVGSLKFNDSKCNKINCFSTESLAFND